MLMNVFTFPIRDHLVVFRGHTKELFILNPTARWIWESLASGRKADDVSREMAEHFSLSPQAILKDIQYTLADWDEKGLEPGNAQDLEKEPLQRSSGLFNPHKIKLPEGAPVSFERDYSFGQRNISLRDYTDELGGLLAPLFEGFPPVSGSSDVDRIVVFKIKHEFVVAQNDLETGRDASVVAAVGVIIVGSYVILMFAEITSNPVKSCT